MEKVTTSVCFAIGFASIVWAAVNFNSFKCTFNEEVLKKGCCSLSLCGRLQCIAGTTIFIKPLDNVLLDLRLMRKINATHIPTLFSYRQSLCNLTTINKDNYFGSSLMKLMSRYLKHLRCPLYANITVSKFPLMLHFTEAFYPPGEYILNFYAFNNEGNIAAMNVTFVITNKKKY